MKGPYCEKVVHAKSYFDKRSFRTKRRGKVELLIGCPRGKWMPKAKYKGKKGRCAVGTRAHVVRTPLKGMRCPAGAKRRTRRTR